jgi:flavin-dependent dehydrogenase
LEAGAEYHFQSRVSNIGQSDTGCTVNYRQHDEMRELRSRALVIASGFSSDLPRRAGLGQISDYRAGAQVDLEMVTTEVEVYFEPDLFPGGFGWLVPTWGGRGLAGVVATRQAGAALDVFLRRMNTQRKIGLKLSETRHKALPLRPLSRTSNRRIIAVGEAAGQVKATTFGGIYSGLIAAEKAADALEKALAENTWAAKPLFGYDQAWRLAMSEDLKRGWHVRRFYDALSSNQVDRAFSLVKSAGLDRQLLNSKDFSFDWHGALLARLLLKPRLMAGLFSIDTLAALPDLLALARSPKRHD